VIGRGVEETMLCSAAQEARKMGCEQMKAVLIPSAKNQPCQQWFQSHPALQKDENAFSLQLDKAPSFPGHVRTVWS
jgi:predicted enzyme involved in methoxymalonyl-ACP biosynthesis